MPGAGAVGPSLELDVPARKQQKAQAKKAPEAEILLELAIDPRSLQQPAVVEPAPHSGPRSRGSAPAPEVKRNSMGALALRREPSGGLAMADMASDASLLAEHGEPPSHWLLSPFYALRVLRKQRDIKAALVGRREEAARAATALEDALVAFAERVKPAAQNVETYANLLGEARKADELLRSRDAVLAADQDAHRARLAAVASRLAALEADLSNAQGAERAIATEIASSQGALGRAESKLKRAESELRAASREGIESQS
ncbi:MAG: hypothetical protein ACRENE_26265 [Polyangiaceae bacterium]